MAVFKLMILLLISVACDALYIRNTKTRCEDLNERMCSGLPYRRTFFPNSFGHASQEKARQVFKMFHALIQVNCFRDMKLFLCSMFFPICTKYDRPIPPCRSLCKKAKKGCLPIMKSHGYGWPEILHCKKFPRGKHKMCIARPDSSRDTQDTQGKDRKERTKDERKKEKKDRRIKKNEEKKL